MPNVVSIAPGAVMPAYMLNADARKARASINQDVASGPNYPTLSIKGKVFAVVKGDERKVITRADDPESAASSVSIAVVRANSKARVFFGKQYVEGESGPDARPDCSSPDGVTPDPTSPKIQSAKCAVCPQAVWGSRAGLDQKGTACTVNTRMAVFDPEHVVEHDGRLETYLLRVPAASKAAFAQAVKAADARGIPYNALVLKVGFEMEVATPKLTFKMTGFLSDDMYNRVNGMYDDELIKDMVGLRDVVAAPPAAPEMSAEDAEIERLIAEREARRAGTPVTTGAAPAPAPVTPPPAPAAAPAAATLDLSGLDAMMGAAAPHTNGSTVAATAPVPVAQAPEAAPAAPRGRGRPRRAQPTPEAAAALAAGVAPTAPPVVVAAPVAAAPAPVAAPAVQPAQPAAADDFSELLGSLDNLLAATDD